MLDRLIQLEALASLTSLAETGGARAELPDVPE